MYPLENRLLLVDGYNIINAWEDLAEAATISLETARMRLIEIMANYSALTGVKVIVVFDAYMVEGRQRFQYSASGVEVVFTKEGETADHYIEKFVDAVGRKLEVTVATSDWIEQQIVIARGATRVSARELREDILNWEERQRKWEKELEKTSDTLGDLIDPKVREILEENKSHKDKP